MRKFTKPLLFIFIFSSLLLFFSGTNYSDTGNSVTKYNIAVDFNSIDKTLKGSETITYTNSYEDSLKELCLHLYPDSYKAKISKPTIGSNTDSSLTEEEIGSIDIYQVSIDGKSVSFTNNNQLLRILLETPLQKGSTVSIGINFKVKIPLGTDRLGYKDDVYSITNWYPIMSIYNSSTDQWDENAFNPVGESNYSDASDYNVILNTPEDMVIAPTGSIISENTTNEIKTSTIASHNTRDFVFMMSNKYKIYSSSWDGIKINSYYIDGKGTDASSLTAKHLLSVVTDSIKFYSNAYGKYPYPALNIAETYLSGGAMEYPSLIQMGEYTGLDKKSMTNHSSWLEDAAAHETGHQWWYVVVGNNEFLEPLMDESINTFSTAYYFEKRFGKYNENSITSKIKYNMNDDQLKPLNSSVDVFSSWNEYQTVIYGRGPEVFEDLMTQLGENTFIKVMKTYFERFKFKNGSIQDFANVLGEVGNSKIKDYFLNSINNETYFPKNISLKADELKHFKNLEVIEDLQQRETSVGINISSLVLRGLRGEKLTLVLPSKLTAAMNKLVTSYATKIKTDFKTIYGINIAIVKDNGITENQKLGSLIILGNNENNSILKQYKPILPLKINTKNAVINKTTTSLKNLSALYAIKNPKNNKEILLVIYWKDNLKKYNILEDNYDQYIVNSSPDIELRGQF